MSPWGWDPSAVVPVPLPPGHIFVREGQDLQPIFDDLTEPTIVECGAGDFYGDSANPSTPLTMAANAYGSILSGQAQDATFIKSPILEQTGRIGLQRIWVTPDGTDYGVKIYNGGSPFIARNWMKEVGIGAISKAFAQSGLGPRDGLVMDGCGVFLAHQTTVAFNQRHGLLVDSTGVEPNTTLKFDMCSFVQNGFGPLGAGVGYGIRVLQSCNLVEFNGGNSEGNVTGEAYCENITNPRFRDFFFETSQTMDHQLHIQNCNPGIIDNCFFSNISGATRAIFVAASGAIAIPQYRVSGYGAVGVIRLDEDCRLCHVGPGSINPDLGAGWIEDYSR